MPRSLVSRSTLESVVPVGAGLVVAMLSGSPAVAQAPPAADAALRAVTPRATAPRDITGYWVSVVSEDWLWRMVTPRAGDFASVPLNDEGRRVANLWSPAGAPSGDEACKAFGAAALMRVPGRVRISWEDDRTLRLEADAGTQTRRFVFGPSTTRGWRVNARGEAEWVEPVREVSRPAGGPTWQGASTAFWDIAPDPEAVRKIPFFAGGLGTGPDGAGTVKPGRYGSLHVVTASLKAGYLRRNGVPYSERARLTEDYDFRTEDDGTEWFTVTTVVDDPTFLSAPFITSTDFKKEPDGSKWRPTSCSAY